MVTNGPNEVIMSTSDEVEGSDSTVEIKIKTMDSQTHTLWVIKCVPVPALKEQVATVTGVLSEQQRLICRGKVLRDDQLLSAYHVEDGHTLHLVSKQPAPSSSASALGSEVTSGHEALNFASTSAQNHGNHVAHSLVFEAINVDQGDRSTSSLSRILSSLLNTIAAASSGTGSSRSGETDPERPDNEPGNSGPSDVIHPQPSPAAPRVDVESRHAAFRIPPAVNLGVQQPVVIPDSLTTIHQFLGHIRDEFRRVAFRDMAGEVENNAESSGVHVIAGQNPDFQFGPVPDGQGGLPSVASLSTLLLAARELLVEQAGGCLSPVPFHPASSFGGVHMGTANSGHNLEGQPFGSAVFPRNFDIRIHAGDTIPVSLSNFGVQSNGQQPQEQTSYQARSLQWLVLKLLLGPVKELHAGATTYSPGNQTTDTTRDSESQGYNKNFPI